MLKMDAMVPGMAVILAASMVARIGAWLEHELPAPPPCPVPELQEAVPDASSAPARRVAAASPPADALKAAPSAKTIVVAKSGGDYPTIQQGVDAAGPGYTVLVKAGTYNEAVTFPRSGKKGDCIVVKSARKGNAVVDPAADKTAFRLQGVRYIVINGFKITNSKPVSDKSGVRLYDKGHHIKIKNNEIYGIKGEDAMGITVYGKDGRGLHHVVIDGNSIHDCEPAHSEALVVNGNVRKFKITDNTIRDVNNIGIDVIGGEKWLSSEYPHHGLISGNTVIRANSAYDGSAAGIYSDGAGDLVIERNTVSECDFGIEIGAENKGVTTKDVVVRSNFVHRNYRGGIIFGGYASRRGRVKECAFANNTLYKNCRPGQNTAQGYKGRNNGEIIIQWADDCVLKNNVLWAIDPNGRVLDEWGTSSGMSWGSNIYYRKGSKPMSDPGGAGSIRARPKLAAPGNGDLHVQAGSPAIDAGADLAESGATDIDGDARVAGARTDIGADEVPAP